VGDLRADRSEPQECIRSHSCIYAPREVHASFNPKPNARRVRLASSRALCNRQIEGRPEWVLQVACRPAACPSAGKRGVQTARPGRFTCSRRRIRVYEDSAHI
jgi:hypothetical protein